MPQDAFTLRVLCGELNQRFTGGKINRIVQPSLDELLFTLYTGKRTEKLLIDVNPAAPRIGVTEEDKESPLTAPNFCMLLRKHLLNAEIKGITLVGFDRIVKIDLAASSEFFDAGEKTLFVELMGRYSNVILTENGKVLGGNRGINCFDNGVRPLIVGRNYVFPPVGDKKLPSDKSLIVVFSGAERQNLPALVTESVQGVAQSTAQELADEYFDNRSGRDRSDGEEFFEFMNDFLYRPEIAPCVYCDKGAIKDVCVFPYGCIKAENKIDFPDLISAERYYYSERGRIKAFTALKERLTSVTSAALKKAQKRLNAVSAREKDAASAENNRLKGELILANVYKFKGREKSATLLNYYDGTEISIPLDENLSAAANAEKYYKKYNKQKRALAALAPEKERAEKDIDYLRSLLDFIDMAENSDDLESIKEELLSAELLKDKNPSRKKVKQKTLGREYVVKGFSVVAGRNNTENDALVYSAKSDDIWLHAKDYHSSHVIIRTEGKTVPEEVLTKAAGLCAYYSKGRGGRPEIAYTERKFLKKPPKSKAGFFVYSEYKSMLAEPDNCAEYLKTR